MGVGTKSRTISVCFESLMGITMAVPNAKLAIHAWVVRFPFSVTTILLETTHLPQAFDAFGCVVFAHLGVSLLRGPPKWGNGSPVGFPLIPKNTSFPVDVPSKPLKKNGSPVGVPSTPPPQKYIYIYIKTKQKLQHLKQPKPKPQKTKRKTRGRPPPSPPKKRPRPPAHSRLRLRGQALEVQGLRGPTGPRLSGADGARSEAPETWSDFPK